MRVFFKELSNEWRYIWSNPLDRYSLRTKKYILRRYITIANKELGFITRQLLTSPLTLTILIGSLGSACFMVIAVDLPDIAQLLKVLEGFIISFISTLVAAAIFISTLHRQSSNKTVEAEASFSSAIVEHKHTIKRIFEKYKGKISLEEKISLFKAVPCDSVFDPTDYESFKEWHVANRYFLMDLDLNYNNYLKYPYDSASSVNWNRAGFLAEGCRTAQAVIEREDVRSAFRASANEMLTACQLYSATNGPSLRSYIPVEFVGKRLYRVVVYSIFSAGLILIAITFSNYHKDLFPNIDFNIVNMLTTLSLTATFLSIYLILRYIFMFISYLRDSTARYSYAINSVYIYEPDVSMHSTNGLG